MPITLDDEDTRALYIVLGHALYRWEDFELLLDGIVDHEQVYKSFLRLAVNSDFRTKEDEEELDREYRGEELPSPIKYCEPETGHTWDGQGREPHWLTQRLKEGRTRKS
jgi:hypothetical protein